MIKVGNNIIEIHGGETKDLDQLPPKSVALDGYVQGPQLVEIINKLNRGEL